MNLKEQIDTDIKKAMLAKQKDELEALRGIKSMILLAETDKGSGGPVSEEVGNKLLMKAAKQRKESAEIFKQQDRQDLAEKELFQLEIINRYLPKQLEEEELTAKIKEIIEELGASGPQDMGKVMGKATKELAGRADGGSVSAIVKKLLSS